MELTAEQVLSELKLQREKLRSFGVKKLGIFRQAYALG